MRRREGGGGGVSNSIGGSGEGEEVAQVGVQSEGSKDGRSCLSRLCCSRAMLISILLLIGIAAQIASSIISSNGRLKHTYTDVVFVPASSFSVSDIGGRCKQSAVRAVGEWVERRVREKEEERENWKARVWSVVNLKPIVVVVGGSCREVRVMASMILFDSFPRLHERSIVFASNLSKAMDEVEELADPRYAGKLHYYVTTFAGEEEMEVAQVERIGDSADVAKRKEEVESKLQQGVAKLSMRKKVMEERRKRREFLSQATHVIIAVGNFPVGELLPSRDTVWRAEAAVELALADNTSAIVYSGGSTSRMLARGEGEAEACAVSEARVMALHSSRRISAWRIAMEEMSMSTVANARYTARLIEESFPNASKFTLVSKPDHLRWAMPIFEKVEVFAGRLQAAASKFDREEMMENLRSVIETRRDDHHDGGDTCRGLPLCLSTRLDNLERGIGGID